MKHEQEEFACVWEIPHTERSNNMQSGLRKGHPKCSHDPGDLLINGREIINLSPGRDWTLRRGPGYWKRYDS